MIGIKKFEELSLQALYEVLALRTDVFVVEQNCPYPELDFHDQSCVHVLLRQESRLVGYARVAPPGSVYQELSIGRMVICKQNRGQGFGHQVFAAAVKHARLHFKGEAIKIQAQCYLEDFYQGFGFKSTSAPYPDYGVMHVDMLWQPG
ncbi:MAG: GNAT family N-acetyltransferase [Owenweeksia sp.]|nr:GNAT family N-acetyltransferase [Owenweeksia sp.]